MVTSRLISLFISSIIGIIFLSSGMLKLLGISIFADEIAQYIDVYFNMPFMIVYRKEISISICLIEILLGALSFIYVRSVFLFTTCSIMLALFVYVTGMNLFFPVNGMSVTSCGCFGDFITITPEWSFFKSVLLLILSIYNVYICRGIKKQTA